jgi:hypothetical protein
MINHEPAREGEQTRAEARATAKAYCSIWSRVEEIRALERYRDKLAFKRTGLTQPAKLYGRKRGLIDPAFDGAMQRLWDLGTLPEGRANLELRRPFHLIARGRAPLSEVDVIGLAEMSDSKLYLLPPGWRTRSPWPKRLHALSAANGHRPSWRNTIHKL